MTLHHTASGIELDEERVIDGWREAGLFQAPSVGPDDDVEALILPPPSPNGRLHVGHALNLALQDAYARQRRMAGKKVVWPALIDHGGVATQLAVERELAAEGKTRADMPEPEFVAAVERFNDQNCAAIYAQMQRFGALMDYSELRFLGDAGHSAHIAAIFVQLHERDMVYRSEAIVNWCPRCRSALSELDVSSQTDFQDHHVVRFPVAGEPGRFLEARTRNVETLMGDPGIVVHPDDLRFQDVIGKEVLHPLTGRRLPVLTSRSAQLGGDPGAVRLTPAMCQSDYELTRTANLSIEPVYTPDGRVRWEGGRSLGLREARAEALERLRAAGLLASEESEMIPISVCSRCQTEVQPSISHQWFLRRQPFIPDGRQVLADGELQLRPEIYESRYTSWLDQLERDAVEREDWWESCCVSFEQGISGSRDWCISRQIAWGNSIPAWVCDGCDGVLVTEDALRPDATPPPCPTCAGSMHRERDVLDMAFSCALYAIVVMRSLTSDERVLEHLHRHASAFTGSDLVYFWIPFAAMIGKFTRGYPPFRKVWLHSLVTDGDGRKMSKSMGNVVSFDDAVESVGAEGLRYGLLQAFDVDEANLHIDLGLLEERQGGRRAVADALAAAGSATSAADGASLERRLGEIAAEVEAAVVGLQPARAIRALERFTVEDLASAAKAGTLSARAYRDALALWHPFLPFTTEALFERHFPGRGPLANASWPAASR